VDCCKENPLNVKKALKLIILTIFYLNVFGQSDLFQPWNYQNLYNPATCGLYYQHEVNVGHEINIPFTSFVNFATIGSYSIYSEKLKMGAGLSFSNHNSEFVFEDRLNDSEIKASVSKQLEGKKGAIYSFGLGLGVDFQDQIRILDWTSSNLIGNYEIHNKGIFTSDVGAAFRWKRWNANFSVNHFFGDLLREQNPSKYPSYHFYTDYVFGKKEGFQVTPQLKYSAENGFQQVLGHLMFSYKTKYSLGFGLYNTDAWLVTAAWNIKDKFRISYTLVRAHKQISVSPAIAAHHINLAFLLNKRDLY
jgi:Type IX secretion system membrane protein PorP/SprF